MYVCMYRVICICLNRVIISLEIIQPKKKKKNLIRDKLYIPINEYNYPNNYAKQ